MQPRLPGVGTVREQKIGTPQVTEAPFALTPEAAEGEPTEAFLAARRKRLTRPMPKETDFI